MARKTKAKRPGRPELPKGEVRKGYSVRLPRDLAERAKTLAIDGKLTTAVEYALKMWISDHVPHSQNPLHGLSEVAKVKREETIKRYRRPSNQ